MELYIHFGLYKAGSSYLQHVCAINASYLDSQRIFFPSSAYDKAMLAGEISPGNAGGLAGYLKVGNRSAILKLFDFWIDQARKNECNKVLISSEALVHQLAIQNRSRLLESCASTSNFSKIYALGFLRDPVDHALSTYKHRGKSGRIPDFSKWVAEVYETPKVLNQLFSHFQRSEIEWTYRKYKKDSFFLCKSLFEDWLGIPMPQKIDKVTVNESVSLSEVLLMIEVSHHYGFVADYFLQGFRNLPKKSKGNDAALEAAYFIMAYDALSHHSSLIKSINQHLPKNEKLKLGKDPEISDEERDISVVLSRDQIRLLISNFKFFSSFKGKMVLFRRRLAKIMPEAVKKSYLFMKNNWIHVLAILI